MNLPCPEIRIYELGYPETPPDRVHMEDLMKDFPSFLRRVEKEVEPVPDKPYSAQYRNFRFRLFEDGQLTLEDSLPRVFYMGAPALGVGRLDGEEVIVVAARSRATTALRFLGIYSPSGKILYREVMSSSDPYEIRHEDGVVDVVGYFSVRRIRNAPTTQQAGDGNEGHMRPRQDSQGSLSGPHCHYLMFGRKGYN